MSIFEIFGKSAVRFVYGKNLLQRMPRISSTQSLQYAGVKVNLEDLPEKPKRPLTPYFRFMADIRPELRKDKPDARVTDIVKIIADRWDRITEEARERYLDEYKRDLVNYAKERAKYESQLTDEQKQLMQRAKDQMETEKESRKLKKKMKDLGKPKRPPSAFIAFFNSKVHPRGEIPYKDWVKNMSKEWINLPPELKASYQKDYVAAMENHRRQIQEWEERMIRMGHIDVVRSEALIEPKTASKKLLRTRHVRKNKSS